MENNQKNYRNPWAWVPTLYFAQGIPYVVVMTVSVIMYKRLGISNSDIAFYTSWLYLPWVIKPLWSPFVDMFSKKRLWVVSLQFVIGLGLASVAFTLPASAFFQWSIAMFWLMAFASATHDIAADGFYMLSLEQHEQATFSGVRSTFYRVAMLTGQGLLVIVAGTIETSSSLPTHDVTVQAVRSIADTSVAMTDLVAVPGAQVAVLAGPPVLRIPLIPRTKLEVDSVVKSVASRNIANAFRTADEKIESSWWDRVVSSKIKQFIRDLVGEHRGSDADVDKRGNVGLVHLRLSRPPLDDSPVVVAFEHKSGDASLKVVEGDRLTFTRENWDKGALIVVQLDKNLAKEESAVFAAKSGNIPFAWSVTFSVLAGMFLLLFAYHKLMLPYPLADKPTRADASQSVWKEFVHTFALFFNKKGIIATLAFLLFYRFAEAQLVKMVSPFLLDPRGKGGLGLTTSEVGVVYGTVGVIALLLGGLLGGYIVSRKGLKYWLWIMVFAIHLPDVVFVFLSQVQPESLLLINLGVGLEQFGYGFGFTAYMLYMISVSEGDHKTAHYAICTGIMALGMMLPGMFSGDLQELVGYKNFFLWVILATIPGFLVAAFVKIDPLFAKKVVKTQE
jgi:MFS transporter, PAT family, beta-lactamase induction signal transducer AmpG